MSKQKNAIPMTIVNGILNNSDCVVNAKNSFIRKKKCLRFTNKRDLLVKINWIISNY